MPWASRCTPRSRLPEPLQRGRKAHRQAERLPLMKTTPFPLPRPIRVVFHPPLGPTPIPEGGTELQAREHLRGQTERLRAAIAAGYDRSMDLEIRELPRSLWPAALHGRPQGGPRAGASYRAEEK